MSGETKSKIIFDKPKAILFKVLGVLCPYSFAKTKLIKYSIENCGFFINKHFFDTNILDLIPKIKKFYDQIIIQNATCPTVSFENVINILSIEDADQRKKAFEDNALVIIKFKKELILFLNYTFQFASSTSPVNEIQNRIWAGNSLSF